MKTYIENSTPLFLAIVPALLMLYAFARA